MLKFRRLVLAAIAIVLSGMILPLTSPGQHSVSNPDWEILPTDWGYADLAYDLRPGFTQREYLSGEWAAAVFYKGGQNPAQPIWFQPQWYYPNWESDSDFGVETSIELTGNNNASGFKVYRSVITNADLRIQMTYEMIDTTNGIAQGTTRRSSDETGSSVISDRYIFRQTYKITNISGDTLTDFKFYQFLHGLNMTNSIIDNRVYSGPFLNYQYDNTQRGDSYSFNSETWDVWRHHDTVAMHAMKSPDEWEAGYYGRVFDDSHVIGKPKTGVHLSVEADLLNGTDFFAPSPPTNKWVSGAQRFPMGTLAPGGMTNIDMLLSVRTDSEFFSGPVNVIIHNTQITTDMDFQLMMVTTNVHIDFEETTDNPVIGFSLLKSTSADAPLNMWTPVGIPYYTNFPQAGWNQFRAPYNPSVSRYFYIIQALPKN